MEEVMKMLEKAQKDKLWGNLQIDFHDGEIVLIRKTETTKITGMEKPRHNAYRNGIRYSPIHPRLKHRTAKLARYFQQARALHGRAWCSGYAGTA